MSLRTLLVPAPLRDGEIEISGDEAHHGRTVLRLRSGDRIRVADGAGRSGTGDVLGVGRDVVSVHVSQVAEVPTAAADRLAVAVAIPKGGKYDDLVRQLCELGVGELIPLRTARSERDAANPERAVRIARDALKQCGRGTALRVADTIDIEGLCARDGDLVVLDRDGGPAQPGRPRSVTLVIGPEGGLDDRELARLALAGAKRVRLAAPILRIETAATAAAAVWAAAWEHPQSAEANR